MQPSKPKVSATLCCCALGGCDCMHECISNHDDMIVWDAWMHEGFIRLHVHMLSQGSEVASLPSHPAMALVAVEQSDGSVHVQAPLKFKLGVPWLFGTHTMTLSSFSLTMLDIYWQSTGEIPCNHHAPHHFPIIPTFIHNPGCWHADCQRLEDICGRAETIDLSRSRHWHAHSPNMSQHAPVVLDPTRLQESIQYPTSGAVAGGLGPRWKPETSCWELIWAHPCCFEESHIYNNMFLDGNIFIGHEVYECDLERNYKLIKEVLIGVFSLWALGIPVLSEFEEPWLCQWTPCDWISK